MSALALPAAPRRWPAALAWILGLGGLAALLALQIESVQAARACTAASASCSRPRAFASRKACSTCCPRIPTDVAGGRPGQHADGGAGRPALATLLGVALGLARLSPEPVASRLAAVIIAPLRNTPVLLQLFVWYGLLLRLPDARQAWEPLPSVLLSNRGLALPALHGWLPQAASLIVAMLIAGWAIRRRRLATDGPAHRGHVLLIRVAPWLALAAQLLAWTLLPAPIVELPVRRGLGLQGGWQPSIEFATLVIGLSVFHAAYIADIVRASVRAVPAGLVEAGQALALSRPDILRLVVAPNAARVALPPYANQCLALIKNSTLAIAIGYQDLMAVINTAITQTGLALEGISLALAAYLGLALALAARCPRGTRAAPGMVRAICTARAWANGRHCLPPSRGKAADAGRGDWPGRPCCWRRCSPPVRSPTGLAQRRLARRRGGLRAPPAPAGPPWARTCPCCCSARCSRRIAAPPWSPAPRCCWRSPSRWARAGCPDGHAPASPSPRWRLPPARCPAGPGRRGHRPAALGRPAGHADPGDRGAAGRRAAGGRSGATAPLVQSRRLVRRRHADRGRARRAAGDATAVRVLRAAHAAGRRRVRSAWRWPR